MITETEVTTAVLPMNEDIEDQTTMNTGQMTTDLETTNIEIAIDRDLEITNKDHETTNQGLENMIPDTLSMTPIDSMIEDIETTAHDGKRN